MDKGLFLPYSSIYTSNCDTSPKGQQSETLPLLIRKSSQIWSYTEASTFTVARVFHDSVVSLPTLYVRDTNSTDISSNKVSDKWNPLRPEVVSTQNLKESNTSQRKVVVNNSRWRDLYDIPNVCFIFCVFSSFTSLVTHLYLVCRNLRFGSRRGKIDPLGPVLSVKRIERTRS